MTDQDWDIKVLRRKQTKSELKKKGKLDTVAKTNKLNSVSNNILGSKAANDYDPENIKKLVTTNQSLGKAIQTARMAKKWKQSDLDKRCNLPKNTCQSYENGKAIYNAQYVNKMARALGVILPRPKKR